MKEVSSYVGKAEGVEVWGFIHSGARRRGAGHWPGIPSLTLESRSTGTEG